MPTTDGAEIEITGMRTGDSSVAVEFKRRRIPNRFGKKLLEKKAGADTSLGERFKDDIKEETLNAFLLKYDDGWRVQKN